MKLLADAALVGFPNAGKSTFISRVSAAKPKIANYPFTTLEPNLGVVSFDGREFVLADIPGLIEGAAEGKGLGHEFLRHTERARVLVYLLDPSETQEEPPEAQLDILRREIKNYSAELSQRPSLTLLNKASGRLFTQLPTWWNLQSGNHRNAWVSCSIARSDRGSAWSERVMFGW
jgi:GTP-binding protein